MTNTNRQTGEFLLIGGAADTCFASLLQLAGGKDAHILVVPHASRAPRQSANAVQAALRKLGATNVSVVMPRSRFTIPGGTRAVYIAGGDQLRLVRLLGDAGLALVKQFLYEGGLVAGTSAGAACIGVDMIAGGMSDGVIRKGALVSGSGLGLLSRVVFDTHFRQRSRFARAVVALNEFWVDVAVGLDEDSAVHIRSGRAQVLGAGHVWVFRRGPNFKSDTSKPVGSATNVDVSILSAGDSFEL